jgi:hypothetical protein
VTYQAFNKIPQYWIFIPTINIMMTRK